MEPGSEWEARVEGRGSSKGCRSQEGEAQDVLQEFVPVGLR